MTGNLLPMYCAACRPAYAATEPKNPCSNVIPRPPALHPSSTEKIPAVQAKRLCLFDDDMNIHMCSIIKPVCWSHFLRMIFNKIRLIVKR